MILDNQRDREDIQKKLGKLSPGDPSNLIKSLDGKTAYKIANKRIYLVYQI